MIAPADPRSTARLREPPLTLLRKALGPPRALPGKLARLGRCVGGYADQRRLARRLERLRHAGVIDVVPSPVQLVVGSIDMLRFFIAPAADDYYAARGIHFGFHQLLRFLEEPASLADPVGFFSTRDGIIGHLMQVVHTNPTYDVQLLTMFADGLDELERQLEAMLAGTHPRAGIAATIEEPDYHARLLAFVRAFRSDPAAPPPLRSNIAASAYWRRVEQTFGTLPAAMRYFAALPAMPAGAVRYLARVSTFDQAIAWAARDVRTDTAPPSRRAR